MEANSGDCQPEASQSGEASPAKAFTSAGEKKDGPEDKAEINQGNKEENVGLISNNLILIFSQVYIVVITRILSVVSAIVPLFFFHIISSKISQKKEN